MPRSTPTRGRAGARRRDRVPPAFRARPPQATLRWAASQLGSRRRVVAVRRLLGGSAAATHLLTIETSRGRRDRVVLRRFVGDWIANEPNAPADEARHLGIAARADLPTPELIAADLTGAATDVPALLLSRLPGRPNLQPRDLDAWLRQQAEALPPIHAVTGDDLARVERYVPWIDLDALEPPRWTRAPEAWATVIALARDPRPRGRHRFIHRDYHPMNVLWSRGRLTGVVDWTNARVGPPGIDVAWARQNLVVSHGVKVAERFRAHAEAALGREQHPVWDALGVVETLDHADIGSLSQWHDLGLTSLTKATVRRRFDAYARSIASRA